MNAAEVASRVAECGFTTLPGAFSQEDLADAWHEISNLRAGNGIRTKGGVYAVRRLLQLSPAVLALAASPKVCEMVAAVLGARSFPVRGILFDKTPEANWLVPWHQDLTICVRSRRDVPGFGPWSTKAGVVHVQPPAAILERMLAVRIHLDAADADNGALRVLPGTHNRGRLSAAAINEIAEHSPAVVCAIGCCGVVLMKPLLLHASSAVSEALHRRVIHIEFACEELPGGLEWIRYDSREFAKRSQC